MRKKTHRFLILILSVFMVLMMSPQIVLAAVPDAPDYLDAYAVSSSEIDLEWGEVYDATSYYIYRSTSFSGTYLLVEYTTSTSYEDDSLSAGTEYYYKIRAHNSSGFSSYSSYAYATTEDTSLDAPDNLGAYVVSSSEIELEWDEVDNATSYYVFRSTSLSGTYSKIATVTTEYYSNTGLSPGKTYYYKVQAHNSSGNSSYSSYAYATTSGSSSGTVSTNRLAGLTRYETAAKIAENGWTTSYYAVIAGGEDYPDALCGAPLAYQYNAPILLTSKDTLDYSTSAQLDNLNVKSVFIIGGTGVVSAAVEQSIVNMGISVTRIAGTDRYDTSLQVAKAMNPNSTAIIATGTDFPDALSIASIAAMKGYPILLSPRDYLTSGIKTFLGNISSTIVVGGTGVISNSVYNQLPSPTRLSGLDRYTTNMAIINNYKDSFNFKNSYLATGLNFPDALAGSALASIKKAPIFLVDTTIDSTTSSYIKSNVTGSIVAFGGTGVVSDDILSSLGSGSSTTTGVPDAPENLEASAESSSEIYLSWDEVSDATSYYVYRSTSDSGTYTKIATVSTTYYTDDSLSDDTTYYYKVAAVNSNGTSAFSSIISATTDPNNQVELDTVTGLSATAIRSSEVYLEWDELDDAEGYYIYSSTSSSGYYSKVGTSSTPYYTCTGLTADKTYYFKVKAYADTSISKYYSSYKYAKTFAAGSLSAPTNLEATAESPTAISLIWDTVSGADTYLVFRAKSSSAQYELVETTDSASFTDSGLSASTTYYYKLLANNGNSSSGYSSKVYAKTDTAVKPDIPSNVNAEATSSSRIYLTWDAVDGATKYYIYRSASATGTYTNLTNTTNTYYSNTGLPSGKTYYYKVRAYNSAGYSDYSDYDSATTD